MAVRLVICNRKGGTGKTTVSVNLAAGLANTGLKVLLLDLDSQGHCSSGLGIKARDMGHESVGMHAKVWKTMASNPRRIGHIKVELQVTIPSVTPQQKTILERTTKACPVARSLHPDTQKTIV
ncbi:MAG: AAA family ATPase, partial [Thalassolituus sp.]